MTRSLFGTDGVRGTANIEPMTADTLMRLAQAVALQFQRGDHRHVAVIGKDTRLSCYMIEQALTAGFLSVGMDVVLLGPLPTPAVAHLTRTQRADVGVMITASHNPYKDNGVKFFGPDGFKLSDGIEAAIESRLPLIMDTDLAKPEKFGRATRLEDAGGRYIEFAKSAFPRGLRLDNMRIVIDCAHGAGYRVAPQILWELGADVVPMAVGPDGLNINAGCGATDPEALQQAVLDHHADIGIALDGDGDRVIIVDEKGRVIDGDQIMAVIAAEWQRANRLAKPAIVATVMSNLGLERYLQSLGIALHRARVGDRYVVETMRDLGVNMGGEQSGHVVLSDYATTGDGMLAALQILAVLQQADAPASQILNRFVPVPQLLKNVRLDHDINVMALPQVEQAIADANNALRDSGRVLVRKSGTESLVRVMVEGDDLRAVQTICDGLVAVIKNAA